MIWTAVCDLQFRDYLPQIALDTTYFNNNAKIYGNIVTKEGYVTFQDSGDKLVIPSSDSLRSFIGLKIEAMICPSVDRRNPIVTGELPQSFRFGIISNNLMGAIDWYFIAVRDASIPLNEWSHVSFEYDGVCIGRLKINREELFVNVDMPMGFSQPGDIIIGYDPGDGSTFKGSIGHLTIYRSDYKDLLQATVQTMFCGNYSLDGEFLTHELSPRQACAMKDILILINSLDPEEKMQIQECAKANSEKFLRLFRTLRAGNIEYIQSQERLRDNLLNAWCRHRDVLKVKRILRDFLVEADPEMRNKLITVLNEALEIGKICEKNKPVFDRIRELLLIVSPELSNLEAEIRYLIETF